MDKSSCPMHAGMYKEKSNDVVGIITNIMNELNADMFVLEEIEHGALDPVVESLVGMGAGLYKVAYGTTGGDQRVAFIYDTEWIRANQNIEELFFENRPMIGNKQVFP